MPFNDHPLFWIVLPAVVAVLIIILVIFSKRKNRQISGYFLLAEPTNEQKKTVSLIELDGGQRSRIKELSDSQATTDEQWAELWKSLRLSPADAFDWRPTVKYHFKQNGIYLIQANGQGTHIKLDTKIIDKPLLPPVKKSF